MFVLVSEQFMNPMKVWLCGLDGCYVTDNPFFKSLHWQCDGERKQIGMSTIMAVLVLVSEEFINPTQLWLCGLVGRRITTILHELWP